MQNPIKNTFQNSASPTTPLRPTGNCLNQSEGGVTFIELMMTVSIVAILVFIGVPSYYNLIRSMNVEAESNLLMGDLQYARSQAIKQGYPVSVCTASNSGTPGSYACSGSTSWNGGTSIYATGWVTYLGNTTGVIPAANILRIQKPLTTADTLVSGSMTAVYQWCFNSFGFPTINYVNAANSCGPVTTAGSVTVSSPSTSVPKKTVCVSSLGNMQTVTGDHTACH